MKLNTKQRIFILALLFIGVLYLLLAKPVDISRFTINEMADIANNTKDYTDQNGYVLPEEYKISINLSDLESNIGKELYNDGTYKIYVSWVDNTGHFNSGGYRIGFRAKGIYSRKGASLISGGQHKTVDEHSFTTVMSAKMTAAYKNRQYNSPVYGASGINYKDGDDFAFYVFPSEAYKHDITLQETGIVELKVTDLFQNIWSLKS